MREREHIKKFWLYLNLRNSWNISSSQSAKSRKIEMQKSFWAGRQLLHWSSKSIAEFVVIFDNKAPPPHSLSAGPKINFITSTHQERRRGSLRLFILLESASENDDEHKWKVHVLVFTRKSLLFSQGLHPLHRRASKPQHLRSNEGGRSLSQEVLTSPDYTSECPLMMQSPEAGLHLVPDDGHETRKGVHFLVNSLVSGYPCWSLTLST